MLASHWSVDGAPASPKCITANSNLLIGVTNAVSEVESGSCGTLLEPFRKSSIVITLASQSRSIKFSAFGMGYGSGSVTSFTLW